MQEQLIRLFLGPAPSPSQLMRRLSRVPLTMAHFRATGAVAYVDRAAPRIVSAVLAPWRAQDYRVWLRASGVALAVDDPQPRLSPP